MKRCDDDPEAVKRAKRCACPHFTHSDWNTWAYNVLDGVRTCSLCGAIQRLDDDGKWERLNY